MYVGKRTTVGVLLLFSLFTNVVTFADTLTLGIVPQQSASKLAKIWAPIGKRLSADTGHTIVFKTAPNIPEFENRLAKGEYDFAYMNPYHYTVFSRAPGYKALARAKDKQIRGIVVVRKDSDYQDIRDFANTTLAFPAPAAFAASVLPRAEFQRQGIAITPKYVSSHDSVYRAVAKGLYPAGGGVIRTFKNVDSSVRDQLKILWTTKPYTPHAIASHARVPEAVRQSVLTALTRLDSDDAGRNLLDTLKLKGFVKAVDADWNDVRELDIDLLLQLTLN